MEVIWLLNLYHLTITIVNNNLWPEHYKPPTVTLGFGQRAKRHPMQSLTKGSSTSTSTSTSTGVTSKSIYLPPTLHKIPKKNFQAMETGKIFYTGFFFLPPLHLNWNWNDNIGNHIQTLSWRISVRNIRLHANLKMFDFFQILKFSTWKRHQQNFH